MDKKAWLIKKAESFYSKHTFLLYFVFFYAFIFFYHTLVAGGAVRDWTVDSATYTHHLVDYSFGFCTKFLPGAIYHIFFKEVYSAQLNVYLRILVLIFFAALAFFMAKALTLQKSRKEKKTVLILSMFYLTGPCTFAIFTQQLGMLDLYWMLFGALFFFAVRNKFLKYLVPVMFVLTLLVHFSSLVSYLFLFVLILLYESLSDRDTKTKTGYGLILVVSVFIVAALFMYFLLYENANLKYDMASFNNEITARNKEGNYYYVYFEYALYKFFDNGTGTNLYVPQSIEHFLPHFGPKLPVPLAAAIAAALSQAAFNLTLYATTQYVIIAAELITLLPLLILFAAFWLHMMKTSKGVKKLLYLIALAQFYITFAAGILSSVDVGRWCCHAFIVQFTFALYVAVKEKGAREWFEKQLSKFRIWQIMLYMTVYALIQVPAYC